MVHWLWNSLSTPLSQFQQKYARRFQWVSLKASAWYGGQEQVLLNSIPPHSHTETVLQIRGIWWGFLKDSVIWNHSVIYGIPFLSLRARGLCPVRIIQAKEVFSHLYQLSIEEHDIAYHINAIFCIFFVSVCCWESSQATQLWHKCDFYL
jgi:hypothetical protein